MKYKVDKTRLKRAIDNGEFEKGGHELAVAFLLISTANTYMESAKERLEPFEVFKHGVIRHYNSFQASFDKFVIEVNKLMTLDKSNENFGEDWEKLTKMIDNFLKLEQ